MTQHRHLHRQAHSHHGCRGNGAGVPIAAGTRYSFLGILIGPMFAVFAMNASSLSVVTNSLRLRRVRI
ncbi:hypothetical protein QLQ85_15435 [Halomonas sp. M4R5S39]|uniref:hypothetical protein n=1 Tax=Halomonas kalidii TaxID=3043293 RepID=UPI0024A82D22|nr:hypothetical protein [Halomonas kalidii]MDI5986184.1 hypothetical protein [Halomonas kalidii]